MRHTRSFAAPTVLGFLFVATTAAAQVPPPGAPAPTDPAAPGAAPPAGAPTDPAAPVGPAPPPGPAPPAAGAPPAGGAAGGDAAWAFSSDFNGNGATASGEASAQGMPMSEGEAMNEYRRYSLMEQNSLYGSTGLLRVFSATSGAEGTFRVGFVGSWFTGSGWICNDATPCPSPTGGEPQGDDVNHVGARFSVSATVTPWLEAYAALHSHATSNNQGRPQLLQVLGDSNFGVKGFTPVAADTTMSFGGAGELWLLNGTGGVGVDGGGTSFALRGLMTADFNNRTNPDERVPLRLHLNLGYMFDQSGALIEDTEKNRGGRAITRIERAGLDINRVDQFQVGLGVEGMFSVARPFLEWTVDVPMNRQGYTCNPGRTYSGDGCLGNDAGFGTTPSRLSLGSRFYPAFDGLALTAGVDIGTGATADFIEEVAPEAPWKLHIGASYAFDTQKPEPVTREVIVEKPAPVAVIPPERFISGTVVEKGTTTPVPDAIVRYDGRDLTAMLADSAGRFTTGALDPGTYTFNVSATGYRDGQCSATVAETPSPAGGAAPPAPGAPPPAPGAPPGAPGAPADAAAASPAAGGAVVMPEQGGMIMVNVQCELEALPKVGNFVGQLVDAEGGGAPPGAMVKITDRLNRELELAADGSGAFRFEQVPPGVVKITVTAPGYLTSVGEFEIKAREDTRATISINKKPAKANVTVTGTELKLKKQVHFQHNSAEILPDSAGILEEIADVMRTKPELRIEVQGHTDNTGSAPYNLRLSQERAEAVRAALIRLGIAGDRLEAKGYGQEKPIAGNNSDAGRAKNRRVALIILK